MLSLWFILGRIHRCCQLCVVTCSLDQMSDIPSWATKDSCTETWGGEGGGGSPRETEKGAQYKLCINSTQILDWSLTKLVGRPPNPCWKPKEKAFSFRALNGWQLEESGPQEWKPVFRGLPGSRGSTNIYYNICRGLSQNQGALPTCTTIFIKCPTWSWRYGSVQRIQGQFPATTLGTSW